MNTIQFTAEVRNVYITFVYARMSFENEKKNKPIKLNYNFNIHNFHE